MKELPLSLLFPLRCPVCDRPVKPFGGMICRECRTRIRHIRGACCMKCGKALGKRETEYCFDCGRRSHLFDQGAAVFEYGCMRQSIYRYKYMGRQEYHKYYAAQMAACLGARIRSWKPDLIIPVPLHKERQRKRGYNQAALIAAELGKLLGIPVDDKLVTRVRNTLPQKNVEGRKRQNNLKKAFKINADDVKLNTIVIIDDIYTTGSTIDAMAAEFRQKGVKNIYFAALAIGAAGREI